MKLEIGKELKYRKSIVTRERDRHPAKMTNWIWAVHILTSITGTQRKSVVRRREKQGKTDAVNSVSKE